MASKRHQKFGGLGKTIGIAIRIHSQRGLTFGTARGVDAKTTENELGECGSKIALSESNIALRIALSGSKFALSTSKIALSGSKIALSGSKIALSNYKLIYGDYGRDQ